MPLGFQLIIWVCSLSAQESSMKHCLYLFLCMAVRQCYGRRRSDLELGMYRWTTSEDCWVLGGWTDSRMQGYGNYEVIKRVDEWIDEGVPRWFGHVDMMKNDRFAKSLCRRVCW